MRAQTDRSFVAVGGAGDVLVAALGAGSPWDAARRLRDLAPTLDLAEARAASQRDGRGVVVADDAAGVLAVRWFAPGVATSIHEHGSWGAAVVVDGHDRYERYALRDDGRAAIDTTFWLEPGDAMSWLAPPGDVHRQQAAEGGATELVLVTAPPPRGEQFVAVDVLGAARPLADAMLAAYRDRHFAPLREHYHDDVLADVNVPSWRFQVSGPATVEELFDRDELGLPDLRLRSFRAVPTADGCVVEVEVRVRRGNDTVQWRDIHVLHVLDGKVAEHVNYCTGHWDAATIAAQDAEAPMVRP
jgi:predicted metal-dependent enzyme (double-stranded beta helix superfamily)/ketosteroid isomerase-like protein